LFWAATIESSDEIFQRPRFRLAFFWGEMRNRQHASMLQVGLGYRKQKKSNAGRPIRQQLRWVQHIRWHRGHFARNQLNLTTGEIS
jgi:hypothetical protein